MEDHRWWWRSFASGGSTGFFIYAYSFFYYFHRSDMFGFMQVQLSCIFCSASYILFVAVVLLFRIHAHHLVRVFLGISFDLVAISKQFRFMNFLFRSDAWMCGILQLPLLCSKNIWHHQMRMKCLFEAHHCINQVQHTAYRKIYWSAISSHRSNHTLHKHTHDRNMYVYVYVIHVWP